MKCKNKTFLFPLFAVLMILATTSCIKEDMGNCGISVNFTYTHNILSANAFEDQADQVTLYVFDEDGILVQQFSSGSIKVTNKYRILLSGLKNGKYRFVAWAQSTHLSTDQSYFSIPSLAIRVSSISDLTYALKRTNGIRQHELNNFLVGMTETVIDDNTLCVTVDLKKVTNKIRVVILPYTSDSMLDVADYDFSIVDKVGNGRINYDYTPLPDKQITYLPYYAANLETDDAGVLLPNEIDRAAAVEINTSRLLVENAACLRITDKKEGRVIVSINLPWIFSLTEMEDNKNWSLQEYLDRQDRYTIMLYFDGNTWMNGTFIINGWVINIKDIEL